MFVALSVVALPAKAFVGNGDDEQGEHTEDVHHGHALRHIALFTGVVNGTTRELTLGGDFTHQLPGLGGHVSLGAYADATLFAEHVHTLVGAGLAVTPLSRITLAVFPGAAFSEGHRYFTVRTGVGYAFHVGRMSLAPTLNLDVVEGHVTEVIGLNFGFGF